MGNTHTSTLRVSLEDYELALLENRNSNGAQQSFCELFGAEHLLDNLGEYLCYRQIRQCISDQESRKRSRRCIEELLNWLSARGDITPQLAGLFMIRVNHLEQDLPQSDRAGQIIAKASQKSNIDPGRLDRDDFMDFDIWTISRTETDRFWFQLEGADSHQNGHPFSRSGHPFSFNAAA